MSIVLFTKHLVVCYSFQQRMSSENDIMQLVGIELTTEFKKLGTKCPSSCLVSDMAVIQKCKPNAIFVSLNRVQQQQLRFLEMGSSSHRVVLMSR